MSQKKYVDVEYNHASIKLDMQYKRRIPGFGPLTNREHSYGNLYRHPVRDVSPDYNLDSVKIQTQALKNSPKKLSYVDLSKQGARDCMQHMKGNDFYRNIEAQNARMDFLKNLLQASNED